MSSAPERPDSSDALEKACSAFCDAWLKGEAPDLEAYCRNHPRIEKQLRDSIEEFIGTVESLDLEVANKISRMSASCKETVPAIDTVQGEQLGDFILLRELGRGGMGVVYEARQISLNRIVALKVLPAHLTLRQEAVERFRREAFSSAKMKHPGIVEIHAIGEEEGNHFFAMEFVEGAPLNRIIAALHLANRYPTDGNQMGEVVELEKFRPTGRDEKPRRAVAAGDFWNKSYIETVCRIVAQVAAALEHAHKAGVIHRDVKPSNILVQSDGIAKLTDFGLARAEGLPSLTMTGELSGTPHYISPEQISSKQGTVDHRADIFSLGVTLYELITLQRAFDGKTSQEVMGKVTARDPTLPTKVARLIPKDLETICLKAMEKNPDRRYASAAELLDDLNRFLEFRPITAQPAGLVRRTNRWIRRSPARATVVVMLFLLVVVGPTIFAVQQKLFSGKLQGTLTQVKKERQAKEDALIRQKLISSELQGALTQVEEERGAKEKALIQVEEELAVSNQITDFLENLFQMSNVHFTLGKEITALELLQKGVNSINTEFRDEPEIRVRLITAMARAFSSMGEYEEGKRLLTDVLNTDLSEMGDDHELSGPILFKLADILINLGRLEDAETMINRSLAATSGRIDKPGAS